MGKILLSVKEETGFFYPSYIELDSLLGVLIGNYFKNMHTASKKSVEVTRILKELILSGPKYH